MGCNYRRYLFLLYVTKKFINFKKQGRLLPFVSMRKHFLLGLISVSSVTFGLDQEFHMDSLMDGRVEIENRLLVKVHKKAITMLDVVKKMDFLFHRQHPELVGSDAARYQFFNASWRAVLEGIIDEELILADAEEKKVEVNDGEVRQEMEMIFGPQVVKNLNRSNLSFEEGFELIKRELIVQKMTGAFVRSKALGAAIPKEMYQRYLKEIEGYIPENKWKYRILTIRGDDAKDRAIEVLKESEYKSIDAILKSIGEDEKITISESYERAESEIAQQHLFHLQATKEGKLSAPLIQLSRSNREFCRVFLLEKFEEGRMPHFSELENEIKQKMIQESYLVYNEAYREKLRSHYGISQQFLSDLIPEGISPFAFR